MSQPTYASASGYISEQFFTMDFDVALDAAHPPALNAFTVQINGTPTTVNGVTVNGVAKTVTLTFSANALTAGDIIEFSYTDPTGGNDVNALQGADGVDSASFSASTIVFGGRPGPAAPPTPTVDAGSDSGVQGDGHTNDDTPTLNGTSEANASIKLYDSDGNTVLGDTVADGSGNWSITSSKLSEGSHTLTVIQTDSGKNASQPSNSLTLTIDTEVDAPTTLSLDAGSDSGKLGDGITNDGTPTITGLAEANATVKLYDSDGTTVLGTTTTDGSGEWSITSSALLTGTHKLTAIQTDRAGNVSTASDTFLYTLDTIGPVGMALSTTSVQKSAATNGSTVATLSATDDTSITYDFTIGNGTIDADNGKFTVSGTSLVAAQNLNAGTYHIYMKATDAAGNDAFQIFAIDVTDAPGVTSIARAGSSIVPTATTSVDYTVTFSQAVTGVDISDFVLTTTGTAAGVVNTAVVGSGDTYTITVSGITGDGTIRLDLKSSGTGIQNLSAVDIVGGYVSGQTFTLDHTNPAAPAGLAMSAGTDTGISSSDAITSNTAPTFTGTAEANATVKLYDDNGTTLLGTANADGSGNWSIANNKLGDGNHTLTVTQTDRAGNVSVASAGLAVVIDTSAAAPATPTLATASDSGVLGDGRTNVATPTINGSAEANATVKLYDSDGTTLLGTTTADGSGAWSIVSSTLSEGSHKLSVKQTDLAGNVSTASTNVTLNIDTLAPIPATPVLATASDTGKLGDGLTEVGTPVITGTGEANATVKLYDTDGTTVLGTAIADGAGAWSITSSALSLGAHALTVKQTDVAGNVSAAGEPLALTIQAPPEQPTTPPTTVDGVPVTQAPVTLPGGGTGTQIVVPVVTPGRDESSGNAGVADIPLATNGTANLLLAQVSAGFGLTATGGASQPAGSATEQLIQAILASTPGHSASDQGHLTGNGVVFLNQLASTVPLLVQTITPSGGATTTGGALTLTGTSTDAQHTALVIDTTNLAPGAKLVLNAVDFAAIVGAADVTGNTSGQILTGDLANQQFTVGAGSSSSVFAGGGGDTLLFNTPAAVASGSPGSQGATLAAGTTILHGGLGDDAATFNGASADYTVESHDGYVVVTANAQPNQHALVINAETLTFSDATVAVENRDALGTITGLYQDVLGRQADYLGVEFWATAEKNGVSLGQIALDLISSAESQAKHAMVFNGDSAHDVELLYQGIFSRASDADGLAFWVDQMANGMTLVEVANGFLMSAELTGHKIGAQDWDFEVSA
jgi:uncharacterized repeat protein (TIGR02059 family)